MMTEKIALKGLTKRFGPLLAVDDISMSIASGEVLGFLGPNGAGKSTTMRMLAGFIEPTSGTAEICGFDVTRHPVEVKRRIGYLPEGAPAYGDMTAESYLGFIAEVRGFDGLEKRRRIDDVVDKVDLGEVLRQPIETLSKGFKRRVGLAQAMIHDPEILIMDEPTDGLDPNQKHQVRDLIREMSADKAIIISTHILEEVETVCSRAVIIAEGKIVFDGSPDQLAGRSPTQNAVTVRVAAPSFVTAVPLNGDFAHLASPLKHLIVAPRGQALVVGLGMGSGMLISGRLLDRFTKNSRTAYALAPAISPASA